CGPSPGGAFAAPRQRMMRLDEAFQPVLEDMRVDLRRRDVGMAQHLLNAPEIGAVAEEVAREGVAQNVRRDARRIDAGVERQLLQELAAAPPRQMALGAARGEEEARGRA